MAGIIDSKTRVLDTLVTLEGRRQIAQGKLRIVHVSFTDGAAYYGLDAVSGSTDATARLYLEAGDLPQDQIVFEADDSGRLTPFRSAGEHQLRAGQVITYEVSSSSSGANEQMQIMSGASLMNASTAILDASLTSFRRQLLLGTRDQLFEDDGFAVGPERIGFKIDDRGPITDPEQAGAHVDRLESLFQDQRLSHLPNFSYLPPVCRVDDDTGANPIRPLGNYKPWGRVRQLTYKALRRELDRVEAQGGCQTLSFDPTTRVNRVFGQVFERTSAGIRKMDVIDFGVHRTDSPSAPFAHVFFVGRLVEDTQGVHTFVHLFTLLFE